MKAPWLLPAGILCATVALLGMTVSLPAQSPESPRPARKAKAPPKIADEDRVSVEVARDRGKVMHELYAATLEVLHHHYFQRDKAVLPARAMEDIFSEIRRNSNADARWISVNLKPMSINHEPETEFEKTASRELAAGQKEYEAVEGGFYRRAGAIPLGDGCISCHGGMFRETNRIPRLAGLVISIPVQEGATAPPAGNPAP